MNIKRSIKPLYYISTQQPLDQFDIVEGIRFLLTAEAESSGFYDSNQRECAELDSLHVYVFCC
jgi:hypothetical protein